jgi:hypothetical protein
LGRASTTRVSGTKSATFFHGGIIIGSAATVYHQLGIQPEKVLMAPGNRPIAIVKDGEVQQGLLV